MTPEQKEDLVEKVSTEIYQRLFRIGKHINAKVPMDPMQIIRDNVRAAIDNVDAFKAEMENGNG